MAVLGAVQAHAQIAVRNQGYIPFSDPPINYRSDDLHDPVTKLQRRLDAHSAELEYEPEHGYLRSLLQLLEIPADSQTLVFSKTSFQYPKISPEHPRALYFNDDVYVGAVHEGKALEVVSFDPMQGAIFYLLDERKAEHPTFQRAELDCTQCHIAAGTRGIPGVLLRSVYPTATGTLVSGAKTLISDQESPLSERWGGWYVTGDLKGATHLGNAVVASPVDGSGADPGPVKVVAFDRPLDASAFLAPGSDVVAHLVLAHQTQMHNLITLTNYKTRLALYALAKASAEPGSSSAAVTWESIRPQLERPAEQLLRYMLFVNEAALPSIGSEPLGGASRFAAQFSSRGPRDSHGRSLRDFDLHERIFRYPCSYLIYSDSFEALPEPAKGHVYHRLLQILSGEDQSADFALLSERDRRAIVEILLETKPQLPSEWREYARANHIAMQTSVPGTRDASPIERNGRSYD